MPLISTASALHDIGKIDIPASILNKPGKLTKEEFDTMKTHTTTGAEILDKLPFQQESPLVKTAYAICRWHHERWDGRGYPDGLKGEDIPIAAQVVAMADVYDALTSERCYKKAFGHDKAMEMILNGECGQFNPLLLECLTDAGARLHAELSLASSGGSRRNYLAECCAQPKQSPLEALREALAMVRGRQRKAENTLKIVGEFHKQNRTERPFARSSNEGVVNSRWQQAQLTLVGYPLFFLRRPIHKYLQSASVLDKS